MFTGIVEEVGTVQALEERDGGWHLSLSGAVAAGGAKLGDSIAVNGACLTVTAIDGERLTFGLAPETLARTNLGNLQPGDPGNVFGRKLMEGDDLVDPVDKFRTEEIAYGLPVSTLGHLFPLLDIDLSAYPVCS